MPGFIDFSLLATTKAMMIWTAATAVAAMASPRDLEGPAMQKPSPINATIQLASPSKPVIIIRPEGIERAEPGDEKEESQEREGSSIHPQRDRNHHHADLGSTERTSRGAGFQSASSASS